MGGVLVNTCRKKSKLMYLYTVVTLLFISPILLILASIFYNWLLWCKIYPEDNSRCPSDVTAVWLANIYLTGNILYSMSYCCYHISHWLFAFRYFEVAEMFGRDDKSNEKHLRARKISSKFTYLGVSVIVLNYALSIFN